MGQRRDRDVILDGLDAWLNCMHMHGCRGQAGPVACVPFAET